MGKFRAPAPAPLKKQLRSTSAPGSSFLIRSMQFFVLNQWITVYRKQEIIQEMALKKIYFEGVNDGEKVIQDRKHWFS